MNTKPESFPLANIPFPSTVCSNTPQTLVSRANFWNWYLLTTDFIWKGHSSWQHEISRVHLTLPPILIYCLIVETLRFQWKLLEKGMKNRFAAEYLLQTHTSSPHRRTEKPQLKKTNKQKKNKKKKRKKNLNEDHPTLYESTSAYSTGIRYQSHQRMERTHY